MDLVGDKLREIFDAQSINIALYDAKTDLFRPGYTYQNSERIYFEPMHPGPIFLQILAQREPKLFSTRAEYDAADAITVPGTAESISGIYVPLLRDNETYAVIAIENNDRENAYSESDLRLLTTLANSMSVALENARLFDETQRLFQQEQQRAAELAIINSVQQGLASNGLQRHHRSRRRQGSRYFQRRINEHNMYDAGPE